METAKRGPITMDEAMERGFAHEDDNWNATEEELRAAENSPEFARALERYRARTSLARPSGLWSVELDAANPNMARVFGPIGTQMPEDKRGGWYTDIRTARLIAAAPELAGALQALYAALDDINDNDALLVAMNTSGLAAVVNGPMARAREAIIKARGK